MVSLALEGPEAILAHQSAEEAAGALARLCCLSRGCLLSTLLRLICLQRSGIQLLQLLGALVALGNGLFGLLALVYYQVSPEIELTPLLVKDCRIPKIPLEWPAWRVSRCLAGVSVCW